MDTASTAVKDAEEQVEKAACSAEALIKLKSEDAVVAQLEKLRVASKGPFLEARSAVNKLKVRAQSLATMCRKQSTALQLHFQQIEETSHTEVVTALRAHVKKEELTPDAFFQGLGKGESCVPCDAFRTCVEKLTKDSLTPAQLEIGLRRYSAGVTKMATLSLLQRFLRCIQDIAITSSFDVKDGKSVRKIAVGEVAEVVGEEQTDEE